MSFSSSHYEGDCIFPERQKYQTEKKLLKERIKELQAELDDSM